MLFIPTLPVKVEFPAILIMLSNTKNAKQGIGELRIGWLSKYSMNLRWPIGGGGRGDEKFFLELPRADARQLKIKNLKTPPFPEKSFQKHYFDIVLYCCSEFHSYNSIFIFGWNFEY